MPNFMMLYLNYNFVLKKKYSRLLADPVGLVVNGGDDGSALQFAIFNIFISYFDFQYFHFIFWFWGDHRPNLITNPIETEGCLINISW